MLSTMPHSPYLDRLLAALKWDNERSCPLQYKSSRAKLYMNIGEEYHRLGMTSKAEHFHLLALPLRISMYGRDHQKTARVLEGLAKVYFDSSQYERSYDTIVKMLRIRLKGGSQTDVANGWFFLGVVSTKLGRYTKAETCFQKSLRMREGIYGEINGLVMEAYEWLGQVYVRRSNFSAAADYFSKASYISLQLMLKNLQEELDQQPTAAPAA